MAAIAAIAIAAVLGIVLAARKFAARNKAPADTLQDLSLFDDLPDSASPEIDPLAEAEVYLAYGNRQQALSLLEKAADLYPQRADIRDKLRELA